MINSLYFHGNKLNLILWIFFFAIFIVLFVLAFLFSVPAEDAVILYEYAKNLANTGIITYGGSETPIEGATDFLWMLVIALFKVIGINEFASALLLNFIGLVIIASLFKQPKEKIFVGAAFLLTPFLYASLNGFSAIFFSAFFLITLKLLLQRSKYLYLSLLVLCLIRPDGVIWGAGCVLICIFQSENFEAIKIEIKKCVVWLIMPGLLYFIWRYWYFSELLPLPFVVKSTGQASFSIFHLSSIYSFFIVLSPLIFCLISFSRNKGEVFRFFILFILPLLFYSTMRLEQNIGNRFMAPLFFAGLYLVSRTYEIRALILFVTISIFIQIKNTVDIAELIANSTRETIYYLSQDLQELHGRMLITEAGRLTYYSNWFSEDSWGLNTPRYAHRLLTTRDVGAGNYDLIVAHCDFEIFNLASETKHDGGRSWLNQCKSLISFIKQSDYEVFLVPYYNNDVYLVPYFDNDQSLKDRIKTLLGRQTDNKNTCKRYDIYAVSSRYPQEKELKQLLFKYGGIRYDVKLNTIADKICFKLERY